MLDSTRLRSELGHIQRTLANFVATDRGKDIVAALCKATGGTTAAVLWQALFSDCLRVVYTAISADGKLDDEEIGALYEFVFSVARHYANVLPDYREFAAIDDESTRSFLNHYANDSGLFGERATKHWPGLTMCRSAANLGENEPLERYERMISWLVPAACAIGRVTESDPRLASRVAEIHSMRTRLAAEAAASAAAKPTVDPRLRAFLGSTGVFASIQQAASVFETDPFDVEKIHQDARTSFEQLLEHALDPGRHSERGRILLILGESGAGKTHLLRGFRRHVHEYSRGFVAYAQMNSKADDYARYLLQHVIDSLSRPYAGPSGERTGLRELALGLGGLVNDDARAQIEQLAEGEWELPLNLQEYVRHLGESLLQSPLLSRFNPDLLRALLYALHPDQRTTSRVYQYLRCEKLNDYDQQWLGGIESRTRSEEPIDMIRDLAKLAFLTRKAALVLMVDQAELSSYDQAKSNEIFDRAINTLYSIVSEVPSAIAVVACLSDVYNTVRDKFTQSMRDRLDKDPPAERLQLYRSYEEIEALVGRRLSWLYAQAGVPYKPEEAVYPIPPASLRKLVNRRTRDVLQWCHQFQARSVAAKKLIDGDDVVTKPVESKQEFDLDEISTDWNDKSHDSNIAVPESDEGILDSIAAAAKAIAAEQGISVAGNSRKAIGPQLLGLRLTLTGPSGTTDLLVAVTNRAYYGGAFNKQIEQLRKAAGRTMIPVAVRTLEFSHGSSSLATVGQLVKAGGRRAYIDASTLRTLAAFQIFKPRASADRIAAWQRRDRPVSSLQPMSELFDLQKLTSAPPGRAEEPVASTYADNMTVPTPSKGVPVVEDPPAAKEASGATTKTGKRAPRGAPKMPPHGTPSTADSPSPGKRAKVANPNLDMPLLLGTAATITGEPRTLDVTSMLRHTGILGASGSGKTTMALNMIEQLLERDVAVIMLDRKGDLAGYARVDWWKDTASPTRAKKLSAKTDVRLFTPGTGGGRPLALSLIPDLRGIPDHERNRMVIYAADALAAMMDSNTSTLRAILTQAVAVLSEAGKHANLNELLDLIERRDDQLLARASRYDDKHFKKLVEELETVRIRDGHLFDPKAEQLTIDTLIGRGPEGKVPLSIISTRFLGEIEHVQSWVAHLIACLSRYAAQSPSQELRVVFMLDEADIFMPAGAIKPPSKEPLQDLLKRGRSAGLGVVLSSQSPADFDYRSREQINTWFLGKIADQRSIDKMKQLFEHKPAVGGKLATQDPGHFVLLQDGSVGDLIRTPSMLRTTQIAEPELMALAAQNRGASSA